MTTAATRLLALLGHPVAHSRSPAMMTHAFGLLGLDAVYVATDVSTDDLPLAMRGLAALGAVGANVTVPHKVAAATLCDILDPAARTIGAVNTLRFDGARVHGFNTDAPGAVDALRASGFDPKGARVVVLGAGGAARAIATGLVDAGAVRVSVLARNVSQARDLADRVRRVGAESDADDLAERAVRDAMASAQLVVQATSAGLEGRDDDAAVIAALSAAPRGAVAMDAVYAPRETRWLATARAQGLHAVDGLGMLAAQAARALEVWFGAPVNAEILRQFLDASEGRE